MKESISYTVTLNFVLMFFAIFFAFLFATLIYYRSNKVSNVIINSIEKYEGFNDKAINVINNNITALGYNKQRLNCSEEVNNNKCKIVNGESKENGYCVYLCEEEDYYYYRVKTNLFFHLPIIDSFLSFPIYSNTNRMYDFEKKL